MIRVRLATRDGSHVADVNIIPFDKLPDVLIWGTRSFAWYCSLSVDGDICRAEYREVFAHIVGTGMEAN